jgi:cytochrome c oxidase subunit II
MTPPLNWRTYVDGCWCAQHFILNQLVCRRVMKKSFQAIIIALVVLFSTTGFRSSEASETEPRKVQITAKQFAFEPSTITLKKGEPVELEIKSADVEHGMYFSDPSMHLTIPKHGKTNVTFTPEKEGDFIGNCSVFCGIGHGGMMLTLHVVE